jgi:hypothetical protein
MMKGVQKITRLQLKINQNTDFILFGLVSSEPDYKLSLSLNKKFKISLKNISPVILNDLNESDLIFSRFSHTCASPDIIYNLVSNRSGKNYLLKKLKNVDFLLQIQDIDNEINMKSFTEGLREIDSITAVFNIDLNTIKDKNIHYLTQ